MFPLGFGLLALILLLQSLPILLVEIVGEAGIGLDLLISAGVLLWIGSQGNAWLRKSLQESGFKLVSGSEQAN